MPDSELLQSLLWLTFMFKYLGAVINREAKMTNGHLRLELGTP